MPLTRRPGGIQAYKFILPQGNDEQEPQLRTHDGYDWAYVLNGTLRLVLGEQDLILKPGEAAEFDTRTPHWFGATAPVPSNTSASSADKANASTSAQHPNWH